MQNLKETYDLLARNATQASSAEQIAKIRNTFSALLGEVQLLLPENLRTQFRMLEAALLSASAKALQEMRDREFEQLATTAWWRGG